MPAPRHGRLVSRVSWPKGAKSVAGAARAVGERPGIGGSVFWLSLPVEDSFPDIVSSRETA